MREKIEIWTIKQYFCHKIIFKELSQSFPKRYDMLVCVKN